VLFEKQSPSKDRKASPSQVRWAGLAVIGIYVVKTSSGGYKEMWAGKFFGGFMPMSSKLPYRSMLFGPPSIPLCPRPWDFPRILAVASP